MSQIDEGETGYRSVQYVSALAHMGTPLRLQRSGGWLLRRPIADSGMEDAQGPYPILACADWSQLRSDIEGLPASLVSVTVITDPFGGWTPEELKATFPDVARPYKAHYFTNLREDLAKTVSKHHQRAAQRAMRHVSVDVCHGPRELLADWLVLYHELISRHAIVGPAAFPSDSLARQLGVPGLLLVRAQVGQATVGLTLWYLEHNIARYHLGAYSQLGYQVGASHAIFWSALTELQRQGITWAHLGGSAGLSPIEDGLDRFKRGWASGTRPAWLCGRILRMDACQQLAARLAKTDGDFFPAYRTPSGRS